MQPSVNQSRSFKRALILSLFLHAIVFALVGLSNYLTSPGKSGLVHYVNLNFVGMPGGGGGSGGSGGAAGGRPGPPGTSGEKAAETPPPAKQETMKELTVAEKAQTETEASLRHPVEEVQASSQKKAPPKKAAISAPVSQDQKTVQADQSGQTGGTGTGGGGSGLRIGVGEGPGGFGSGYGDPLSTSSFPYTYYLQIIIDRVSSNWFTAINNLDYRGDYQSVIYFKILRNGQIADLKIEQPSELPALDLTARRAVELAAPFPPLPRDFESEYLVIHLIFERSK